jgi:methylmalonyl-CoA/ethylmalonyl-CoA epimerase
MKIHHIGCLVDNIKEASLFYSTFPAFISASQVFNISDQKVKVCFIDLGNQTFLELIEPHEGNGPLRKMQSKNISYYHIGYAVDNVERKAEELCMYGCTILNSFQSEAFENRMCMFLYTPDMHLIELIETKKIDNNR